ncbi:MAG: hypothetical protein MPJ50_13810, partial [Pirellulales bacterium]|nr:hypothetical protein [Pirellulales bacterium]
LGPQLDWIDEFRQEAEDSERILRTAREDLHRAMASEDWTSVVTASETVLDLAPHDQVATQARGKAWKTVGAKMPSYAGLTSARPNDDTKTGRSEAISDTDIAPPSPRFQLWIDGIGGYLVCEGDDLTIGQPSNGKRVDIPILGDLSQRHATLRRCGEGYLLVPNRQARVNGKSITEAISLADRAVIELGSGVRLIFRQPHPYSTTATLQLASSHRTQPACDGIILMADNIVLGAESNCHVVCRDWQSDVVLFNRAGSLHCQYPGPLEVNGASYASEIPLPRNSQITAEEFSMSLEDLNE